MWKTSKSAPTASSKFSDEALTRLDLQRASIHNQTPWPRDIAGSAKG
jgi:hypothetical protein